MQHIYLLRKLSKLEMVSKVSPKCLNQKPKTYRGKMTAVAKNNPNVTHVYQDAKVN